MERRKENEVIERAKDDIKKAIKEASIILQNKQLLT